MSNGPTITIVGHRPMSSTTVYVRQLLSPTEATRKRRTLARLGVESESTSHGDMVCVTFSLPPTVSLSCAPKPSTPPPPRPNAQRS